MPIKILDILESTMIHFFTEKLPKETTISQLVHLVQKSGKLASEEEALNAVLEREKTMTTGIGKGFAIPHGKYKGIKSMAGALGIAKEGIDFQSMDKQPVQIIFLMLSHPQVSHLHLSMISLLTKTFKDQAFKSSLLACNTSEEAYNWISQYEKKI